MRVSIITCWEPSRRPVSLPSSSLTFQSDVLQARQLLGGNDMTGDKILPDMDRDEQEHHLWQVSKDTAVQHGGTTPGNSEGGSSRSDGPLRSVSISSEKPSRIGSTDGNAQERHQNWLQSTHGGAVQF